MAESVPENMKDAPKQYTFPVTFVHDPEVQSAYATNCVTQIVTGACYLTFFEMIPPIVLDEADLKKGPRPLIKTSARLIVSHDDLPRIIQALQHAQQQIGKMPSTFSQLAPLT